MYANSKFQLTDNLLSHCDNISVARGDVRLPSEFSAQEW